MSGFPGGRRIVELAAAAGEPRGVDGHPGTGQTDGQSQHAGDLVGPFPAQAVHGHGDGRRGQGDDQQSPGPP